jgi:hypothetical protein
MKIKRCLIYTLETRGENKSFFIISTDTCHAPVSSGTCREEVPKWFFNKRINLCQEFLWGGCEEGANRYSTSEECEMICIHKQEIQRTPGNNTTAGNAGENNTQVSYYG